MKRILDVAVFLLCYLCFAHPALAQADVAGSKDFPGISRMPNTFLQTYNFSRFDSFAFPVKEGNREKKEMVEGARTFIRYKIKNGTAPGSALETTRNYQRAFLTAGGQILYEAGGANNRTATFRLQREGLEVWVYLNAYTVDYELTIVERQGMAQQVTIDAAAMESSLASTGRVAIYGIYFDTGQAEIKPESAQAIAEIAKLLTANPAMQVYVAGHTDMVGDARSNQLLSQHRAQAVVNELVAKHGIARGRLDALGLGPYAPVASNKTEAGRAKNRRVELIDRANQ